MAEGKDGSKNPCELFLLCDLSALGFNGEFFLDIGASLMTCVIVGCCAVFCNEEELEFELAVENTVGRCCCCEYAVRFAFILGMVAIWDELEESLLDDCEC